MKVTFLPIVDRELRAAARRKSTHRVRFWTALIAIFASSSGLGFVLLAQAGSNAGNALFKVLTGYAFGLCLLAGVFLTADCLSEEKREGTLGLLFLADLKGYDVVLGKFIAMSLNAFYGLLTLLPVTALPMLLGGVTAGEFWRMALALVNALFFSLATGLWVSAFSRDSQRAMGGTLALLLFLVAGLPALAARNPAVPIFPAGWILGSISPFYPFACAMEPLYLSESDTFWRSLVASHLLGWLFLALASRRLGGEVGSVERGASQRQSVEASLHASRSDAPRSHALAEAGWLTRRGSGSDTQRARERRSLGQINPVLWLMADQPGFRGLVWTIVGGWGVIVITESWASPRKTMQLLQTAQLCGLLLKMLVGFQACSFFAQGRRSGALELLLCTPLRHGEVLKGQWLALHRFFFWPLLVFLLLNFVPWGFLISSLLSGGNLAQIWNGVFQFGMGLFRIFWFTLNLVVDVFAIGWAGMWLALSLKRPNLAPALTILFVLLLASISFCGMNLFADLFLILWGATKLQQDFRWVLSRQYQAARPAVPPVLAR